MDINKDDVLLRKLALDSLFNNGGYKILEDELNSQKEYVDEQVDSDLRQGALDVADLHKLNYNLGRKSGLYLVLTILDNLKSELAGEQA